MHNFLIKLNQSIDWTLVIPVVFIAVAGIITMNSFVESSDFSQKQIIWLIFSTLIMFGASLVDWRFMKRTETITLVFVITSAILLALFLVGSIFKGAKSWFDFGAFAFQPVDFAKLSLIFVLAKYFSRRHIEIRNVRHIMVSGFYAFIFFVLVLLQPDFGSAIIIFLIWLGMVLVSGISKKHLMAVFLIGLTSFALLWFFVFQDYQKLRIYSFLNPLTDLQGAGYNAHQSTIAVGSGQLFGKGIGLGSQSKLEFLPEYQTDFIFAAFAEEWGFVGGIIIFILYGFVFYKILFISKKGSSNFEILFGVGFCSMILSHFVINIGMNIGIMPVTGITLPFMSYGGSHLLAEFLGLGVVMGMSRYSRAIHKEDAKNEIIGVV